jgi:hypothetical protein
MSHSDSLRSEDLVDKIDEARDEVLNHVIDEWDASMRAIGVALIGSGMPAAWTLVYRHFLEQQGLLYEPGAEWRFLESV